jgi:hypothetical protein
MPFRQKMDDVVVLIPGIMGSTLARDGVELWGLGVRSIAANLLSLGRPVRGLELPGGIGDEAPGDGVSAVALMPSAQIIPGFFNLVTGYDELTAFLEARFELDRPSAGAPGNLIHFPYDWRLSNRLNGRRLADKVVPALDRWRASGRPDARLIFICHSMGGLVARWFLESLGGKALTRTLITIGTPYRGSINSLVSLANGFALGIGPFQLRLDSVLRSFPSVYQLLPTYDCIEGPDGTLLSIDQTDVPNVSKAAIADSRAFHDDIAAAVTGPLPYATHVIKGIVQPTFQSARVKAGAVEGLFAHKGHDKAGDGTVPRPSSHPPEWGDEGASTYMAKQHGALQAEPEVLRQIFGILTSDILGTLSGIPRLGLYLPDLAAAGTPLPVRAVSEDGNDRLALVAVAENVESGWRSEPVAMRPSRDGGYQASLGELPPGGYRVTIGSAPFTPPVEEVTGLTLVWGD